MKKFIPTTIIVLLSLFSCAKNLDFTGNANNKDSNSQTPKGEDGSNKTAENNTPKSNSEELSKINEENVVKSQELLETACSKNKTTSKPQLITFIEESNGCWGQDGNFKDIDTLEPKDTYIQAHKVQDFSLDLPSNALVCDLKITFGDVNSQSNTQEMRYDDEIYLLYNDFILAASSNQYIDPSQPDFSFESKSDLILWDWQRMKSKHYNHKESKTFCASNDSQCFIPETETEGSISLSISSEIIQKATVLYKELNGGQIKAPHFTFVTTGDNDTQIDCKHSEFKMTVEASYVIQ